MRINPISTRLPLGGIGVVPGVRVLPGLLNYEDEERCCPGCGIGRTVDESGLCVMCRPRAEVKP